MKHSIVFSLLALPLLFSCHSQNKTTDKSAAQDSSSSVVAAANLIGSYVGSFGDNKINLLITKSSGDTVEGRSVVGGNDRPFTGTSTIQNGIYTITAKEPGDNKDDGVFNFKLDGKQPDIISGDWKPNTPTATLNEKSYNLKRRAFVYLQDVGQYPQTSKKLLTDDDVNNLSKDELETMRNEIFAKHGYCFKNKAQRENFEDKDWYIPYTTDVKGLLSGIEIKNIALIKKYEKYAEQYGDEFGR